jgi:catechol 2,3-dioxygenase-like lactoylglutathione lyase family enzyme
MASTSKFLTSILSLLLLSVILALSGNGAVRRPAIRGISGVQILAENPSASFGFYAKAIPLQGYRDWFLGPPRNLIMLGGREPQSIRLSQAPSPLPANLIGAVTFGTEHLDDLARYLTARGIPYSAKEGRGLSVLDPEGNDILFVADTCSIMSDITTCGSTYLDVPDELRIIHVGFVVHDRTAMEHFYKDILGFRPYWHGGMKDGQTDWVSLQVPDGTDWIEFMLNVPDDADTKLRGVMNHIAVGVGSVRSAQRILIKHGLTLTEQPEIGRDGKWQLNVYDPDDTRLEIMGFTPVKKPCCSPFTGPHPKL